MGTTVGTVEGCRLEGIQVGTEEGCDVGNQVGAVLGVLVGTSGGLTRRY